MKKRTIKLFCVGIAGALAVSAYIQKFHKSETDLLFSNIEALADPEQSTNKFDWVPPTINCSVYVATKQNPTQEGTYIPGTKDTCISGSQHSGCPDCSI